MKRMFPVIALSVLAGFFVEGDWLVIPPDVPHQAKPDAGGFSYMIMKIDTGMYPWALIR